MEVLTKFAPPRSAARQHSTTAVSPCGDASSAADSMMTLRTALSPMASRTVITSASTAFQSPATAAPTSITMSTSAAPCCTASRASDPLISEWCLPEGNPATTATTRSPALCSGSIDGDTHTASTPSSVASVTSARTSASVASGFSRV